MEIIQRGSPGLLRSIQQGAKNVSKANGISKEDSKPIIKEGGAYNSIMNRLPLNNSQVSMPSIGPAKRSVGIKESGSSEKRLKERLLESVETLSYNKEYFNAVSSLFTLYSMDALTEGVLNSLGREDLREIKGIIGEFAKTLEKF